MSDFTNCHIISLTFTCRNSNLFGFMKCHDCKGKPHCEICFPPPTLNLGFGKESEWTLNRTVVSIVFQTLNLKHDSGPIYKYTSKLYDTYYLLKTQLVEQYTLISNYCKSHR